MTTSHLNRLERIERSNSNFLIPISLQPAGVTLRYFFKSLKYEMSTTTGCKEICIRKVQSLRQVFNLLVPSIQNITSLVEIFYSKKKS